MFIISKCRGDWDLGLCTPSVLALGEPQRSGDFQKNNVFWRRKNRILPLFTMTMMTNVMNCVPRMKHSDILRSRSGSFLGACWISRYTCVCVYVYMLSLRTRHIHWDHKCIYTLMCVWFCVYVHIHICVCMYRIRYGFWIWAALSFTIFRNGLVRLLYSNLFRSCSRLDLTRITRRRTQLSGEPDHRWEGNGVESTGQAAGLARKTQGLDHPGFRGLWKAPTGYDTIFVVHTSHVCVRVTKNEQENTKVKESV
jgi:hypothetical protein